MNESPNHDHLIWREIDRRPLLDAPIFQVYSSRRRAADGKESEYILIDSPDWCNVIAPVSRDDGVACFVMAQQYRHGSRTVSVEFPGGLVDEGEKPEAAALRELEEETGFTAERLRLIGRVNPNPAFMSNTAFTYFAEGARFAGEQSLDENERLDAVLVPIEEITEFVRPDFHVHAIMMSALYWYRVFQGDGLEYDERMEKWEARQSNAATGPLH
ncbi:MAG TPA: NUDIX hydrolase [Spirochaetia bacterium]|nr:NUDIX hydrolase [Spirochaetia bacterium]